MNNENGIKESEMLTDIEIDVIGEVMNISMGAAATAMSTFLDRKVNITTPKVTNTDIENFEFSYLEPVVGVLIKYIEGFEGINILLLRQDDVKMILAHLMSMEPSDITELDEIHISAISEIMNQMMGSSASALASFLGRVINISPPEIMDTTNQENIKDVFSLKGDSLVSIRFYLQIEGLFESEFISAMDPKLAKEIVKLSLGVSDIDMEAEVKEEEIKEEKPERVVTVKKPAPVSSPAPAARPVNKPAPSAPPEPRKAAIEKHVPAAEVYAAPYIPKQFDAEKSYETSVNDNNLELIMSVPIEITVELGKTRKKIKDIAELTLGHIVELDRQAGDRVDVIANGRLIARGDVVVVDDNYSVRITEIIKPKEGFSD